MKDKPQEGKVLAVGPGDRHPDTGERIKVDLKEGDRVLFQKHSGTEFKLDDEEYIVLSEKDILVEERLRRGQQSVGIIRASVGALFLSRARRAPTRAAEPSRPIGLGAAHRRESPFNQILTVAEPTLGRARRRVPE